jgi:hypothetical protein
MVRSDILVGYDTYHIDEYERAVESVKLLAKIVDGQPLTAHPSATDASRPSGSVHGQIPDDEDDRGGSKMEQIPDVTAVTVPQAFHGATLRRLV